MSSDAIFALATCHQCQSDCRGDWSVCPYCTTELVAEDAPEVHMERGEQVTRPYSMLLLPEHFAAIVSGAEEAHRSYCDWLSAQIMLRVRTGTLPKPQGRLPKGQGKRYTRQSINLWADALQVVQRNGGQGLLRALMDQIMHGPSKEPLLSGASNPLPDGVMEHEGIWFQVYEELDGRWTAEVLDATEFYEQYQGRELVIEEMESLLSSLDEEEREEIRERQRKRRVS